MWVESNAAIPAVLKATMARRNCPVETASATRRQATRPTATQPFVESVNVEFMSVARYRLTTRSKVSFFVRRLADILSSNLQQLCHARFTQPLQQLVGTPAESKIHL